MPRISNALYARGYSREYADNAEADRHDRMREEEIDRQLEASARLRDAAPELLAALLDALPYIEDVIANPDQLACFKPGIVEAHARAARAAIAKAINQ
jgi:hypothetical protein